MINAKKSLRYRVFKAATACCCLIIAGSSGTVSAQSPQATPATGQAATAIAAPQLARMERLPGVWVEGSGFDVTYGATYDTCAQRCLDNKACVMIEFYRPQKKCNLYNTVRPTLKGGSADVGVRR